MKYNYKVIGGSGALDRPGLGSQLDASGQDGFRLVAHEVYVSNDTGNLEYVFIMEKAIDDEMRL